MTEGQSKKGDFTERLPDTKASGVHASFRQNDAFFRMVLESLDDYALFTTDIEGNISSWNTGAENILGYAESEIINKSIFVIFTDEDRENNVPQKEMTYAVSHGKALDERYHVRKDGSQFWASGMLFPLYDEGEQLRGFTKILRDSSLKKQNEELINRSRDYAESIVDTAREPLLVLHEDLTIDSANRAFFKMFNVSEAETLHKHICELGNGQWNRPALLEMLEKVVPENVSFEDYEVEHEFESIGKKTMLLNARKLYRAGNHTNMLLLAIEDVTHKKELEKMKDSFIGVASHELKTPITAIHGYVQLLEQALKSERPKGIQPLHVLDKIKRQALKINRLVHDLLDTSRISSGNLSLELSTFSLKQLVNDVCSDLSAAHPEYKFQIKDNVGGDITADRFRLEQVLVNLIGNAIKYSPAKYEITISMSLDLDNSVFTVGIKDQGIGIPPDEQYKLFEKFSRASNAQLSKIKGIGLGLNITAEIIKKHGGKIWVESDGKTGSTFHFTLPMTSTTFAASPEE